jgi:predicted membrane protein
MHIAGLLLRHHTNPQFKPIMETQFKDTENSPNSSWDGKNARGKAAGLGVLVIAAGLLLLARNTGFLDESVGRIVFSWEMLLIAIGVVNILWRQSFWSGVALITMGGFFLLVNFYHMPFSTWKLFFPALIILAGLQMIFGPSKLKKRLNKGPLFAQTMGSEDYFEDIAVFGGGERKIVTPQFKGGRMIATFGGSKIDLSHSGITAGDRPVIEVLAIFGGTTLIVPADWNVKVEVFNIFGGYVDKRIASHSDYSKTLIIKGLTIFGGGEVKSF